MKPARKRLGELALRTSSVEAMTAFYRDVIGLELYATVGSTNFLKISDDIDGHPQLLAIFEKSWEFSGPENMDAGDAIAGHGTLHHYAFALEYQDFQREKERLESLGQPFRTASHSMFGWHSLYLYDPDGNSVEFVCYEPAALDAEENLRVLAQASS